jgi:hypothetical protein
LAGEHAPDHETDAAGPLVIDVDATLVTAHSEKESATPTFKRGFGFHPSDGRKPPSSRAGSVVIFGVLSLGETRSAVLRSDDRRRQAHGALG